MSIRTKNYCSTDIDKFGDKGLVKKFYGKAHQCFTELMVALSRLSNSKKDKIMEQKLRNQLQILLANPGEHGCFFPVRKMPIYQDIISGDFMRRAQIAKLLVQATQQLTKQGEQNMNQDIQTKAELQNDITSPSNAGHHFGTTLIGGVCMAGALMLLPEAAQATVFNVDDAGKAVFEPLAKLVTDHYGKAVVAVGGAGAIMMPGDLRTKAIGFGIGAALAGLAMVAVKTGFGM